MHYLNTAAYKICEGLVNDISVHKHHELDRRQTLDRQFFFLLQFLSPEDPTGGERKFQHDPKKKNLDTVTVYGFRNSGHIKIPLKRLPI